MGHHKALLLQMQPNRVSLLKLMWHLALMMTLFVLSIGFFEYIMGFLVDVMNYFSKLGSFVNYICKFCFCSCKG